MGNTAVIYKSIYGTTEKYAEIISRKLGARLINLKTEKKINLDEFDTVIFGGGIYAGDVNGVKSFFSGREKLINKNIIICTCGISTPDTRAESVNSAVKKALPDSLKNKAVIFNLGGVLDYGKLGFVHRSMLSLLMRGLRSKPEAELDDTGKRLLGLRTEKADLFDEASADRIIEYVKSLKQ